MSGAFGQTKPAVMRGDVALWRVIIAVNRGKWQFWGNTSSVTISCISPLRDNRETLSNRSGRLLAWLWWRRGSILVLIHGYMYMCWLLIRQKIGLINPDYGRLSVVVPVFRLWNRCLNMGQQWCKAFRSSLTKQSYFATWTSWIWLSNVWWLVYLTEP